MEAILLAAGEGSRLRPFTADKPKPMVRAANKPILQHAIEALVQHGVKDITLVVGYHRERVQAHLADGKRFGARISYAFQDALTGTARALATAPRPEEPFLVLSGDNVIDGALVKAALGAAGGGRPALVVHRSDRPSRYGVATLDGSRLTQLVEKPLQPRSEWVNTGIYAFPPEFHDRAAALAKRDGAGLPDVIQAAIKEGVEVQAVRSDALWSDAVYPWDLLRVHADVLLAQPPSPRELPGVHAETPVLLGQDAQIAPGTTLGAGTCIGNNVAVGPNCVVENCVLYDDVQIGAGSILRNTVVGAGTRIGPRFTALSGPVDIHVADGWHHLEDVGAIVGEDCLIGGATTLLPGCLLGNHVRVAPGKTLQAHAEDRSYIL